MSQGLLIIPPLVKYTAGPLLGPALLAGAARDAGHTVDVLDLNIRLFRSSMTPEAEFSSDFAGDHDKPRALIRSTTQSFIDQTGSCLPSDPSRLTGMDSTLNLPHSFQAIDNAAEKFLKTKIGLKCLSYVTRLKQPDFVGFSVLFSDQVLAAIALSRFMKTFWPGTPILWGGAHISALATEISLDARYGNYVDGFIAGYAEETLVEILNALDDESALPGEVFKAGGGYAPRAKERFDIEPAFTDLHLYGIPRLTLPTQTSRGCAYARCLYCTYPSVEGLYRAKDFDQLKSVVAMAESSGAVVSIKDSLVVPSRLEAIAKIAGGRVLWSACTKLNNAFTSKFLTQLKELGCQTLEIGVETLDPQGQVLIDKIQSRGLLLSVMDSAAIAGLPLVLNYITGFPGLSYEAEQAGLNWLKEIAEDRAPDFKYKIEHNYFQLERRAPLTHSGLLRVTKSWPWSSVLEWELVMSEAV